MTEHEAQTRVVNKAIAQKGYHEKASNSGLDGSGNNGSNNYTKYARDLDAVGYYNGRKNGPKGEWCDIMHDWVHYDSFKDETGTDGSTGVELCQRILYQPPKSLGAGCYYSAQYYKQNKAFYKEPELADQIFFDYGSGIGHTGIVVKITNNYVYTIEGNSNNQVEYKKYSKNNRTIAGYGRPNWSLLTGESKPVPTPTPTKQTLSKGSKGQAVKDLQNNLLKLGYDLPRYGADGDFGDETLRAVKDFQKVNGLEVDGIVGPKTHSMIAELLSALDGPVQNGTAQADTAEYYTVKSGDTLIKIGYANNTTAQAIAVLNGIKKPYTIYVGQKLRIR